MSQVIFRKYTASWCNPCKMMKPVIEALSTKYSGKVQFEEVDIDTHAEEAERMGILSVPTMHIIVGEKIMQTLVGYQDQAQLEKALAPYLA